MVLYINYIIIVDGHIDIHEYTTDWGMLPKLEYWNSLVLILEVEIQ